MDELQARRNQKHNAAYPEWIRPVIAELHKRGLDSATTTWADLMLIHDEMKREAAR